MTKNVPKIVYLHSRKSARAHNFDRDLSYAHLFMLPNSHGLRNKHDNDWRIFNNMPTSSEQ